MKNINPISHNRFEHKLECGCGCSLLEINYWDGEDELVVFLSYYVRAFDSNSIKEKLLNRLKLAWSVIGGNEYLLYEIDLNSKSEINKFKEFVAKIDESKAFYD